MHNIPIYIPIAVAVLVVASAVSGLVRRHLLRLAESLVIGAAVAFGITAWVDGQHHAALAAAAARPAAGGHKVPVSDSVSAAFAVITLIVTVIAFAVLTAAAWHHRARAQSAAGGRPRRVPARGRVRAW